MDFKQAKTQHMNRVWAKRPARGQSAGAHCQALVPRSTPRPW